MEEAATAKALADKAADDTKAAYQSAANAAGYAADARTYAKEALGYAADAATAASKATASLARTITYDSKATAGAAAADTAAGRAESYAKDARDSADQAALDASAARTAATLAEQDATDARAAADRADTATTEAEQAAKDADKYAKDAQAAADRTEKAEAGKGRSEGSGTGIPSVFAVPDESTVEIVSSKQIGTCPGMPEAGFQDCNAVYDLVVTYEADFYLCTDGQAQATAAGCPKSAWTFLQRSTLKNIKIDGWTHTFSGKDIVRAGWQSLFGDVAGSILFSFFAEDLMDCWHGSKTACAWSLATYVPVEGLLSPIARAVTALDASVRTGIGFTEAWNALRTLHLSDEAVAGIGAKAIPELERACAKGTVTTAALTNAIRAAGGGGGYCAWLVLGGPGRWMPATESMADADRAYEQLVTNGVPSGISYKVAADTPSGFVKFDGFQNGTLIDAKNLHYSASMIRADGKLVFPTKETKAIVKQVAAAKGTPIVWYMSDEETLYALKQWALDIMSRGSSSFSGWGRRSELRSKPL
ncbi:hypothetical protein OG285_38375 (plasmid) [Streptomyces sp. NBC_01471]|uniref:hypothetical protein n=1 Tax=Streptomyces sp. NBC_01471 TaxID=2903879 RepID=UPI002F914506